MNSLPVVALVGRPNVGKSTLFNRIIRQRRAVVHAEPGVTRDRLMHPAEWVGKHFLLVDTGGIGDESSAVGDLVREQAEEAIDSAEVILLCVSIVDGVTPVDQQVADLLRKRMRSVIVVANKADGPERARLASELWKLGLGEPVPVSAEHGLGINDLLDRLGELLPDGEVAVDVPGTVRVAIVGKPNVGKSSLVNFLVGERRVIVADQPGTTRDAVDISWEGPAGQRYVLTDTAGLRRRTRIADAVERFSVLRALRAILAADLVVLVVEANRTLSAQERRIANYSERAGKALVVAVNKWDIKGEEVTKDEWAEAVSNDLGSVGYARFTCISALTGMGIAKLMGEIELAYQAYTMRIETAEFNRMLRRAVLTLPMAGAGKKRLNIKYGTQVRTAPPTFVVFVNDADNVTPPVYRFLERQLRNQLDLAGTPIRIRARSGKDRGRRSRTHR